MEVLPTRSTNRRSLSSNSVAIVFLAASSYAGCGGNPVNKAAVGGILPGGGGNGAIGSSGASNGVGGGPNGVVGLGGLQPNVAPGGNFDLSLWELQEPVGSPGSPTIIGPATLVGPSGFQDEYFFTDTTDGSMTFWDPENGVTTPNSNYPRSELRELNADGSEANWPIAGTNTMSATLVVMRVPDHVCVGQIHCGTALQSGLTATTKPLLELYCYSNGDVKLGIENGPAGGQTTYSITNVQLGTKFSYVIRLTLDGTIHLVLNGTTYAFTIPASFMGYGEYFKAGNYDQSVGNDPTVGSTVKFYALHVSHQP